MREASERLDAREDDGEGRPRALAKPLVRAGAGDGCLELLERRALTQPVAERRALAWAGRGPECELFPLFE